NESRKLPELLPRERLTEEFKIRIDHDFDQLPEPHLGFPIENPLCLGRIADQQVNLSRSFVAGIVFDVLLPIEINPCTSHFQKLADGMSFIRGEDEVIALIVLEDAPHAFDILRRVTPIALRVEIAQEKFVLKPMLNRRDRTTDFASDKRFTAPRTLVVKQNAVART